MTQLVITYQAPDGETLAVCLACERKAQTKQFWYRTDNGDEFCSVSRGLHRGGCDVCHAGARVA